MPVAPLLSRGANVNQWETKMYGENTSTGFVTPGRITLATNYANELAEKEPWSSAAACAEKAVERIFGRWLRDPTAATYPAYLPLHYQLVSKVESRMGVHRAPRGRTAPWHPAPEPSAAVCAAPVAA